MYRAEFSSPPHSIFTIEVHGHDTMKQRNRIFLTLVSVLLVIAIFPPFDCWHLAPIAWLPFLAALKNATARQAFYLGMLHGLLTFAGTLTWMWIIFTSATVSLWAILGIFTAFFALFVAKSKTYSPLIIAILWTGFEYFRSELFILSFPWITPGTGLPPNWFTPLIGVYGVSFLIVLANALLLQNRRRKMIGGALLASLVVSTLTFSKVHTIDSDIPVTLIQIETPNPDTFLNKTHELPMSSGPVVWPEYAYGNYPSPFKKDHNALIALLKKDHRILVTGGKQPISQEEETWKNSALTFGPNDLLGIHVKNHPVHLFNDGEKGLDAKAIDTPFGRIGTPICFDCDYQDVIRKMTKDGAEYFLIPSMDTKTWGVRQHEQHGQLFRHRAAENGRCLAVASSSGVTQIIGPHGHVRDRLPVMVEDILTGQVTPQSHRTVFQLVGWLIGPIMLGLSIGAILVIFRPKSNKPA